MSSQPAPTPAPELPPKPAPPPADAPPPVPDAAAPEPAEEGAIFHALLDAGVEAKLAYTAERRMHAMTSRTVAEHTQPILVEVRQVAAQVRDLAKAGAERDRRLDVIVARLDGLKLLGQIMIGAYALLITALIAVFGFLFTR